MKKNLLRDIIINLFASSLCTIALNFAVYPILAKRFDANDYGNILTIIGVINLLIAVLGNCLNNTRLVLNKNNEVHNSDGNYNIIITISSVVGGIVGVFFIALNSIATPLSVILVFITVTFGIARSYFLVIYRINLDYYSQLKTNIIVSAGYIVGVLLVHTISIWPLPFCLGEGIAFFYTIKKGTLINEPLRFTDSKKIILNTYADLIVAGLIGNVIAYFDRFLINPILGAANVAIFSVAAFWGKAIAPFISPTANVMLSYLCQKESKVSLKKYALLFTCSIIPLTLFGLVGILLAPWLTGILYPTLIGDALPYIAFASLGSLIQNSTNLLMPIIMAVTSSRTILISQVIYFLIYLIVAYTGAKTNGLMGFCVSTMIIGVIKTVMYFLFGYIAVKRHENA